MEPATKRDAPDASETVEKHEVTYLLNELGKPDANVKSNLTLPSGANAVIYRGKGKHVRRAQDLMDGNPSLYHNALFHLLCFINGKRLTMEDFDEMDMDDYNELMVAVSGNFTKSPPKT